PYSHHGFELGFGITAADGREKPAAAEMTRMRRLLDQLGSGELVFPRSKAALLCSSYLDESYPFSWQDRGQGYLTLLQGFVLACQAGLDPEVVSESEDFSSYRLILCPATQKLRVDTWRRLLQAAGAGATVYWSYFSGDEPFHQGAWCPIF